MGVGGQRILAALCCAGLSCALGTSQAAPPPSPLQISSVGFEDAATARAKDETGRTHELGLVPELQRATEQLLGTARAIRSAAVLLDAKTGQILAMHELGAPTEGPSLLLDPVAPAASVFKLVTSAALYERGGVRPTDRVCTRGGLRGIDLEHLSPAEGAGAVCAPFLQALGVSRNAVFAQLATHRLLRTDLLEIAENLGFNSSLALDARGKMGALEVPFNDLDFARTAAGFGNSRLSVFGGAQLAWTIASGGLRRPMHLGKEWTVEEVRVLRASTADRLRRAMEITVHSGTAREAFYDEHGHSYLGYLQAAGKTGTLKPDKKGPTASWFIGFAPSQKPSVVVSVLLFNEDLWHRKAPQVARDLLRTYFASRGARGVTSPGDRKRDASTN